MPTESASGQLDSSVVASMAWLLLLAGWALSLWRDDAPRVFWGETVLAALLLLGWQLVSGFTMAWEGQPRAVVNSLWQAAALVVAFFLCRQLVRRPAEIRALVIVMIALAATLSVYGFYQRVYEMPRTVAEFKADPEAALERAGINARIGSQEYVLFKNRLTSPEPTATFALANSLGGFLVPWLLAATALALAVRGEIRKFAAVSVVLVALAACLWFTHSLTAWLAAAVGLILLAAVLRGWRVGRVVSATGVLVGGFLGMVFSLAGGLDFIAERITQKSLLYRFEYWQATVALIGDNFWFGSGPGNFQQFYQRFKLPQASEEVADPHNFLFEIWATAGTPALVALLILLACYFWQLGVDRRGSADDGNLVPSIYLGALGGVLFAFPLGLLSGFYPSPVALSIAAPLVVAFMAAAHPWVRTGELNRGVLAVAVLALLTNLLAAGGISYPGVALSLWLLLGLSLNGARTRELRVGRRTLAGLLCVTGLLVALQYFTAYRPVLEARAQLNQARDLVARAEAEQAEARLAAAAVADPFSVEPWIELAQLRHTRWLATKTMTDRESFLAAADETIARDGRSSVAALRYANWLLAGYRALADDAELLQLAIDQYDRVVELYPNYNQGHAQRAWALHLAGRQRAAAAAATRALELDRQNPHPEQHLEWFELPDPGPVRTGGVPGPGKRDAEQWMRALRNTKLPRNPG